MTMEYEYQILERPAKLGGGWRLRLLEDGEEVGGGVFPADLADDDAMTAAHADAYGEAQDWLNSRPNDNDDGIPY